MSGWDLGLPGVVELPGGRTIRGASHRAALKIGSEAELRIVLRYRPLRMTDDSSAWIRWPDFGLPRSTNEALAVLGRAFDVAADRKVLVTCHGGVGRTGTAVAVLAIFAGIDPEKAVDWTRRNYHPRAVETRRQARWLRGLDAREGNRHD